MGSGRREFGDLGAKFEKALEHLPEQYADRAREAVQKYVPPKYQPPGYQAPPKYVPPGGEEPPAGGDGRRPGYRPPEWDPRRRPDQDGPRPSPLAGVDLTIVSDVRDKLARWNDPAAKLQRQRRRTSRALTLWIVASILSVLYAVASFYGVFGGAEGLASAFAGIAATVVFATLSVRSGARLRRLNRTEVPAASEPKRLPPQGSAAREPMERLAEGEATLAELLRQLEEPSEGGLASVPEVSVEDARATASEAAQALRSLADRVQAIERARSAAPRSERPDLDSAVATLRRQLDEGLDGYGTLVAAAGRAVAAAGGVESEKEALTDATDRLAGLAVALHELSEWT